MSSTMAPRTVLLVGALSLTAGWLMGSSASSSRQEAQASRQSSGPLPLGTSATPAPLTRQLRDKMDAQPSRTPSAGRNPFVFGARRPAGVARHSDEPMAAPAPPPLPPEPPAPVFRLSGIASSQVDGATVLTAIINDRGTLAFVKTGDKLSNGYSVVRVDEAGVVIADASGITQTIRLP